MISQTQSHSAPSGAKNLEVPVLIVGGGGAGLTASMLLSQLGVEHLLVSALPTTSILPKAHVLNQKTMEILTDVGVAEEIYEKSTPAENMRAMGWYAGLAGPDPDFGRRISQIESWGDGYTNLNWVAASPCRSANLPQIRLEPIFKARAEAMNPGGVRFHHELMELAQDADGVTSRIRNLDDGAEYTVRSKYLIGCDGGRTIAKQVGIEHERPGRGRAVGHGAHQRGPVAHRARSARADPLDLVPGDRPHGGARADGTDALGPRQRGVGLPPRLPRRRAARPQRRAGRGRHATRARSRERPVHDPQAHPLDARRRAGRQVPRRPRVHRRRRRASPSAHRRPGPHQRGPGRAQPLLEARRGPRGQGRRAPARHLRARAPARRCAQHPALARELRRRTWRSARRSGSIRTQGSKPTGRR